MTEDWKHIDDVFRTAASETDAPDYSELYWKEFEQMLDAENKKRRKLLWWSSFGSVGFIAILAALFGLNRISAEYQPQFVDLSSATEVSAESFFNLSPTEKVDFSFGTIEESSPNVAAVQSKEEQLITSLYDNAKNQAERPENLTLPISDMKAIPVQESFESNNLIQFAQPMPNDSRNISLKAFAGIGMGAANNGDGFSSLLSLGLKSEKSWGKIGASVGIGVQKQFNPGLDINQRSMVYAFGVTNFENRLSYTSFTELIIPIELNCQIRSGRVGLGLQPRIMMQSKMEFEAVENEVITSSEILYGRTAGLNILDADIFLTYTQPVSKNMQIGMKVSHPLAGRTQTPEMFSQEITPRTMQAQVMITYNLGK